MIYNYNLNTRFRIHHLSLIAMTCFSILLLFPLLWAPSAQAVEKMSIGIFSYGSTARVTNLDRTESVVYTIGQSVVGNIEAVSGNNVLESGDMGLWSFFLLPPLAPYTTASDGDFPDRIEVRWPFDALSSPPNAGFRIFRNNSLLATLPANEQSFQDYNVYPGQIYNYEVLGMNQFGEGGRGADPGFVNPNGVITGHIQTTQQRPVIGAEVKLSPNLGQALSFDGVDDYVEIPNFAPCDTALTIEAWINHTSGNGHIVNRGGGYGDPGYSLFHYGGHIRIELQRDVGVIVDNPAPADNEWHHVAFTWDNSSQDILVYIDGQLAPNSGTFAGPIAAPGQELNIGRNEKRGAHFNGKIDDVRIWSVALTDSVIQRNRHRTLNGNEPNLLAYWKLDEGNSNYVFDLTDNSYDGRVHNGSSYGAIWSAAIAPVQNTGFTNDAGNYIINGIYYGTGTTFTVTPGQETPIGRVLNFDGVDDYIGINGVAIDSTSFSIEFWANRSSTGTNDFVINQGPWGVVNNSLHIGFRSDNTFTFAFYGDDLNTPTGYTDTDWHHWAVTYDAPTKQRVIYRDGESVAVNTAVNHYAGSGELKIAQGSINGFDFSGALDEVRIWNVTRRQTDIQADMNQTLAGTEDGLLAYYQLNEGFGDFIGDATVNNLFGTLQNADPTSAWIADNPLDETFIHEFNPQSRIVTLNTSATSTDGIDFTDISLIPVSGFVRYHNTLCFEDEVEILVDGASYNPRIMTAEDGSFAADFNPGSNHRLSPYREGHTFYPEYWDLNNLIRPIAGIIFKDTTVRSLQVNVYGGSKDCRIPLVPGSGNLCVTVTSNPSCFETIQNITSGTVITFPTLPAYDFVVTVEHPDGNINFDGQPVSLRDVAADTLDFAWHAPIVVDITGFAAYDYSDSCATFSGPDGETIPSGIVLTQGNYYSLDLDIIEDYSPYGGTCPVDTGFVIINNSIADQPDTTLFFGSGEFEDYRFIAGGPNILGGGAHPYQKLIQVTGYELVQNPDNTWADARSGVREEWAYVLGARIRGSTFATVITDQMPMFILRDPPGDKSYAFLEQSITTSRTQRFYVKQTDMIAYNSVAALVPDITITMPLGGPTIELDSNFTFGSDTQLKIERISQQDFRITLQVQERQTTSAEQTLFFRGQNLGDIFVGIGFNLQITDADELAFNDSTCTLSLTTTPAISSIGVESGYVFSEHHISETLIPELAHLADSTPDSLEVYDYLYELNRWINLLQYNADSLKTHDASDLVQTLSFDGAIGSYEHIETRSRNISESVTTLASIQGDGFLEVGIIANGIGTTKRLVLSSTTQFSIPVDNIGIDADIQSTIINSLVFLQDYLTVLKAGFQQASGGGGPLTILSYITTAASGAYNATQGNVDNSSVIVETDTTTTTGYHLEDDDPGDNFWVNVYNDGLYGLYYQLVAGASKCPWEAPTAKRELPVINIAPATATDIHPDEAAVFALDLGNSSETDEAGWYQLRFMQETNPDGAEILVNGEWVGNGFTYYLQPGEVIQTMVQVNRGPIAYDYDDLKFVLSSLCEVNLAYDGLNDYQPFIADTTSFSIHFQRPCSEVVITNPGDGWLLDAAANDTLWITVQGYELNSLFSGIKLQYRPANSIAGRITAEEVNDDGVRVTPIDNENSPLEKGGGGLYSQTYKLSTPNSGRLTWPRMNQESLLKNGTVDNPLSPPLVRGTSNGDGIKTDTWINFKTIPYADLQTQFDDYGVEYIIVPWNVEFLDDGAYEIRAVTTCVSANNIEGTSAVRYGIIERYAPMVFGNPQPSDGVLQPGDDIAISFTELIICNNIVEADAFDLNNLGLYDTTLNELLNIDYSCFENTIILSPVASNYYYENHTLRVDITGIKDLYENAMIDTISWEFWVNRNPIAWSGGDVTATKFEDETITVTRQLVNNGSSAMTFNFIDLNPNPGRAVLQPADWMTVSPTSGTVNPGSAQTITIAFDADLIGGLYADSLQVRTVMGDEFIRVSLENLCYPPDWTINPAQYDFTMTVTAEIDYGPAIVANEERVVVSAFIDNEPHGIANVEYSTMFDKYLAFLTIYGDSANAVNNDPVTIRVWDGLSCAELGQDVNAFDFMPNDNLGNGLNPYAVSLSALNVQEINVVPGWNWISFNVDADNDSLNHVLNGLTVQAEDLIKNQNSFAQYVDGYGWVGTLMTIDNQSMYMMRVAAGHNFEVNGYTVDQAANPIAIASGWNWIAYQPLTGQAVADALASLTPITGDLIKNQFAFAQFVSGYGWAGSLAYMAPGFGYLLKMDNAGTLTYPLPVTTGLETGHNHGIAAKNQVPHFNKIPNWSVDPSAFEFNMTITGILTSAIDGEVIGAFVGKECRGIATAEYIEALDQQFYFLMIYSNTSDETITFKALADDGKTEIELNEQMNFQPDNIIGDVITPFVLTTEATGLEDNVTSIPTEFNLGQNFPNPFNPSTVIRFQLPVASDVDLTIYNIVGQRVKTLVTGKWEPGTYSVVWNAENDSGEKVKSGVYFYRMTTDSGFDSTRKLLLLK